MHVSLLFPGSTHPQPGLGQTQGKAPLRPDAALRPVALCVQQLPQAACLLLLSLLAEPAVPWPPAHWVALSPALCPMSPANPQQPHTGTWPWVPHRTLQGVWVAERPLSALNLMGSPAPTVTRDPIFSWQPQVLQATWCPCLRPTAQPVISALLLALPGWAWVEVMLCTSWQLSPPQSRTMTSAVCPWHQFCSPPSAAARATCRVRGPTATKCYTHRGLFYP